MDPPIDQQEAHSETALEASVKDVSSLVLL